jgi:hypothetical protein
MRQKIHLKYCFFNIHRLQGETLDPYYAELIFFIDFFLYAEVFRHHGFLVDLLAEAGLVFSHLSF